MTTIKDILELVFIQGAATLEDVDESEREKAYINLQKNGIKNALNSLETLLLEELIRDNRMSHSIPLGWSDRMIEEARIEDRLKESMRTKLTKLLGKEPTQ